MRNFRYFFREGVGNMLSHGFMSFAAIGVTVACLLIMGTFSLVAYNANINLQDLQKENAVVAFVGALIGMRVFHHKTKHRLFTISAPIAAAISIVAALCGLMM